MTEGLDRDAVERVLRRAHAIEEEMQSGRPGGIEPAALVDAAAEVGIDPNAVRDSLAVERFEGPSVEARRFDRLAGPDRIVVEREMHLTVDDALTGIESWLGSTYRLAADRRSPSMVFARRRGDTFARVSRSLSSARGVGRLDVGSLVAEAVPRLVGSSPTNPRCVVRISADRASARAIRLSGGASIGVGGAGVAGVVAVVVDLLVVWPIVAMPFFLGGYAVARSGRGQADRAELELERMLSRVDRGERPTGFLGRVARRARDVVVAPERDR